jgi:hypothetical protein
MFISCRYPFKTLLENASRVSSNQSLVMHLNMNDKGAEDLFGYIEDETGKQEVKGLFSTEVNDFVDVKQL